MASVGRVLERRRFLRPTSTNARVHFDIKSCLHAFEDVRERTEDLSRPPPLVDCVSDEWSLDQDFPEVPSARLPDRFWSVLVRRPWLRTDHILLLEARALLRGLEVHVALSNLSARRVLLLTDNMAVCLAFGRRRARNFQLLSAIRRFSALAMSLDILVLCVGFRQK